MTYLQALFSYFELLRLLIIYFSNQPVVAILDFDSRCGIIVFVKICVFGGKTEWQKNRNIMTKV